MKWAVICVAILILAFVKSLANGNDSLGPGYTKTAKGLQYTHASAKAGLRFYPPYGTWPVSLYISGIPNNAQIEKAFVYFTVGYNTATPPSNPVLYFTNSQNFTKNITPANIGMDVPKCWGELGNVTYRGDVTNYISGNGTYTVSSNTKDSATDGFTLLIIYKDLHANFTGSIFIHDGLDIDSFTLTSQVTIDVPDTVLMARAMVLTSDLQDTNGTAATVRIWDSFRNIDFSFTKTFWDFVEVPYALTKYQAKVNFQIIPNNNDCYAWSLAGLYFRMADTAVYIADPFLDSLYCPADTFYLDYDVVSKFRPGNQFKVLLSDSSGNFGNAVVIGAKNDDTSGTIKCIIPANAIPGKNYKIRITATAPLDSINNNDRKVRISKYPLPPVMMSNSPVCEGTTMLLYEFGTDIAEGYTWLGPNNFKMTLRNSNLDDAPLAADGKYVLFKENFSCGLYDTLDVVIKPRAAKPSMTVSGAVCEGDSIHVIAFSSTANITYNLQTPADFIVGLPLVDTVIKPVTIADSGLYRVVASLDGCLSLIDSADGVVYRVPSVAPASNSPVCAEETIELKANDTTLGAGYLWFGPSGFSSPYKDPVLGLASALNIGTYTVIASVHFCSDTDTVAVIVKPLPQVPVATSNSPVCEGVDVYLTAEDTNAIATSYIWTGPLGFNATEKTATIFNAMKDASGIYTITAELDGCSSSDTVAVTIKRQPPQPHPFNNGPLKQGEKIRLNVSNPEPGAIYKWRGPKDFVSDSIDPQIDSMTEERQGIYLVVVYLDACSDSNVTELKFQIVEKDQFFDFYPNPNNGKFTINAKFLYDQEMPLSVTNALGQEIYRQTLVSQNRILNETVMLPAVADGFYYLRLTFNDTTREIPFVIRY